MSVPSRAHRVGVVIATRDRRDVLLRNLPRILALAERPPVIVVDDASSDGTADAVRAAHPEVDVIRLERSVGGGARNVGLRAMCTPYVAFCDDDSWWKPGMLSRAADLLDAHPRLAVVNGHVLVGPDERDDPICEEMARSPLPAAPGQPGHPLLGFVACAVVVRRAALLEVGGFTDRLGIGGEEELLSWDLVAAGWQLSYIPGLTAHHDPPKVPGGRHHRREVGIRNTLWTTWLRRPARAALRRTARDLRRFPRDRVTARGLGRALAGAPWVLRERRVSPPHVEAMRLMLEEEQLRSRARRYVS